MHEDFPKDCTGDAMHEDFPKNCTGDSCTGDHVLFVKALWSGTYPNARRAGSQIITGLIVKDSYGSDKQQHTFTILRDDTGKKMRIKGRNLYRYWCYRKLWEDEVDGYSPSRAAALQEKHARGNVARADRSFRREQENWY